MILYYTGSKIKKILASIIIYFILSQFTCYSSISENFYSNSESKNNIQNLTEMKLEDKFILVERAFSDSVYKNDVKIDTIVPDVFRDSIFNFQVNSQISYLQFKHFVYNDAKISFLNGWIKDRDKKQLYDKTMNLRKIYANSDIIKKEAIAESIIKNEEELIKLSNEIPIFYQKAREIESNYWKNASIDEILRFKQKIKFVLDSLEKKTDRIYKNNIESYNQHPDTIILAVVKPESSDEINETGVVFKIRICSFKGKISKQNEELLKSLELIRKIENYTDEQGVVVYTTGNLKNWSEAELLRNQVQQEGAKNASIEAYHNNVVISEEEAKKINKEL